MAPQVRAGIPGGATLVMTQGESVGFPCTIDSTCLTMEMLCGGEVIKHIYIRLQIGSLCILYFSD